MVNDAITDTAPMIVDATEILYCAAWLYLEFPLRALLGST